MQNDRWEDEDQYWRNTWSTRPYAKGRDYDALSPGYRYGYESAERYPDRNWEDVEPDLERGWGEYKYRSQSTWQDVKNAVRDAWDRVTGRRHAPTR